jgi:hypothetical protein
MVIHQNSQVLLLLLLAATLQQTLVAGLQFLLFRDAELPNALTTVTLMVTSSLAGTVLYVASQRFHSWHERRQVLGRQRIRLED